MQRLERKNDLDWLVKWKDQQIIKVVTGVRRCGKSTLFAIYQDYLRAQGVEPQQIIAINFEDLDFEDLTNYKTLYQYVKARLLPDRMNYIFLDEIQHVEGYEKAVDSLFLRENCDLYLTGSQWLFPVRRTGNPVDRSLCRVVYDAALLQGVLRRSCR